MRVNYTFNDSMLFNEESLADVVRNLASLRVFFKKNPAVFAFLFSFFSPSFFLLFFFLFFFFFFFFFSSCFIVCGAAVLRDVCGPRGPARGVAQNHQSDQAQAVAAQPPAARVQRGAARADSRADTGCAESLGSPEHALVAVAMYLFPFFFLYLVIYQHISIISHTYFASPFFLPTNVVCSIKRTDDDRKNSTRC